MRTWPAIPTDGRVYDNLVAIELRAIAGFTYPLVQPSYKPDGAASLLADTGAPPPLQFPDARNDLQNAPYLSSFPYLATPYRGYAHEHDPEDETGKGCQALSLFLFSM